MPWSILNGRVLRAAAVSLLTASAVYIGVIAARTPDDQSLGWLAYARLALLALLLGLIYQTLVLLPLFRWFRRVLPKRRAPFIVTSFVIWLDVCAGLVAITNASYRFVDIVEYLILPGLVLVLTFAALAYDRDGGSSR